MKEGRGVPISGGARRVSPPGFRLLAGLDVNVYNIHIGRRETGADHQLEPNMSCDRDSRLYSSAWGRHGGCAHWRPFEIAAIVIGFMIFWPIGLALLFLKLWGKSFG